MRDALRRTPLRDFVTPSGTYPLVVDRPLALAGAWYEMFPAPRVHAASRTGPGGPGPSRVPRGDCPRSPRWASTSST
ncbi:hypothetical protein NKG05_22050 [Oerskovia sp. M15]